MADGIDVSYLADIAVHPAYQGRGLGKEIVLRLRELSRHHRKIILYAAPGKDAFYLKLGFKRFSWGQTPTKALAAYGVLEQVAIVGHRQLHKASERPLLQYKSVVCPMLP